MAFQQLFGEILDSLKNKPVAEQVEILKKNGSNNTFLWFLLLAFDPNVEWELPEGMPPIKDNDAPAGLQDDSIWHVQRKMYLYLKGGHPNLSRIKRESLWQQMLETFHKSDVAAMTAIKDKRLTADYGLAAETVNLAFPNHLHPDWVEAWRSRFRSSDNQGVATPNRDDGNATGKNDVATTRATKTTKSVKRDRKSDGKAAAANNTTRGARKEKGGTKGRTSRKGSDQSAGDRAPSGSDIPPGSIFSPEEVGQDDLT